MSTAAAYLCGVPERHCVGSHVSCSARLGTGKERTGGIKTIKAHGNRLGAFKCYVRYLTTVRGYTQNPHSTREFFPDDGGPVLVIAKKIRFGARLRAGKEGTRYMPPRGVSCVIV